MTWPSEECWTQPTCPSGQHWSPAGSVNGACLQNWTQASCVEAGHNWGTGGICWTGTQAQDCADRGNTWDPNHGCWQPWSCSGNGTYVGGHPATGGHCVCNAGFTGNGCETHPSETPPIEDTGCPGGGVPDGNGGCPAPQLYELTSTETGETIEFWSAVDNACEDVFTTYEAFTGEGLTHECETGVGGDSIDSAPTTGCGAGSHSHGATLHPSNVGDVCHQHSCGYGHGGGLSNPTSGTQTCGGPTPPTLSPPPTPTTTTTPPVHGCVGGQHRDGGTGTCHPHPAPAACGTDYQAINGGGHRTATTSACPAGRWVNTCPVPVAGMHGHSYWQPASLPWPSNAVPYGSHGCATHIPPPCSNTGPTTYQITDTSVFSEYSWPLEGPRPAGMMARLRAGEIFFHAAATVPQCQPVNTCSSNPAHGHVPASLTDTSLAGHGCDPHPVPVCAEYGDPPPTYIDHDSAGNDPWPGHRLFTVDTHHNSRDTYCHPVAVCVPTSVVAEAAAKTNPGIADTYDGPNGVPPNEYRHLNSSLWRERDGIWLHNWDSTTTGTPIPECPPEPGPGSTTITVTAPDRLVHGGLLHPEPFTAAVTGFNCTGFCGDIPSRPARIETVNFGMTLTATNGYLRELDQATAGTGEYAVTQCVPTPTHATLIAACAAAPSNDVTTTARTVAVVGLFYNATREAATVAASQRVHPRIIGFTGTYRYWYMQGDVVATATAPLTVNVVSTAGADGQKVWSSLIEPD